MRQRLGHGAGDAGRRPDDEDLLQRFRAGEPAACRALESQMRAAVLAAGHVPAEDLQDLLQESSIQLWRYVGAEGFELRGSLGSLAVRIALARRIDRQRRQRFLVELDENLRDAGVGALERIQETERLDRLHRTLAGLRELCRVLVRGRFLEERGYDDLAAELGRSPETLRVHLHRCLGVLRGMLMTSDNQDAP
jgi:RNA polymerase sigma factor (sigma-70 family)